MKKHGIFAKFCKEIQTNGFKHTYKTSLKDWENSIKKHTEMKVHSTVQSLEDAKELLDELMSNFLPLQDIGIAKTTSEKYVNEIKFLLSYPPSLMTKATDFATFNILLNKPENIYLLLGNKKWITQLLNTYPSCMETISKLDSFKNSAYNVINEYKAVINNVLEENLDLILKADYGNLKENLEKVIENSTPLYIDPYETTRFIDIKGTSLRQIELKECEFGKQFREWYKFITNDSLLKVFVPNDEIAMVECFEYFFDYLKKNSNFDLSINEIKSFKNDKEFTNYIKKFVNECYEKEDFVRNDFDSKNKELDGYSYSVWIDSFFTQIFVYCIDNKRVDFKKSLHGYQGEYRSEQFRLTDKELYKSIYYYYTRGFRTEPIKIKKEITEESRTYVQHSLF